MTQHHGVGEPPASESPTDAASSREIRAQLRAGRFLRWRDRFTPGDALAQGVASLSTHPGRLAATCLAVALGIGALVATIGFAQTGAGQVDATFNSVAATRVQVQPADPTSNSAQTAIPWDAQDRALRLNGVVGAGTLSDVSAQVQSVTTFPLADPAGLPRSRPGVVAASPGLLDVVAGHVVQGEFLNAFHDATAQPVAVLGDQAAAALGITRVDIPQAVFINDQPYAVIGIVAGMVRHPELESQIIVPQGTARRLLGLTSVGELQVKIEPGAGSVVGQQLATALNPADPASLTITTPGAAGSLRQQVSADIDTLFLVLGLVVTGVGTLTIAATTSLSLMERRGEIGLRRALGATRGQILWLLLTECAITGLLGGLMGAGGGVCAVVAFAARHGWTPVLDVGLAGAAVAAGIVLGLAAGLIPAVRASGIEPSAALQEGT